MLAACGVCLRDETVCNSSPGYQCLIFDAAVTLAYHHYSCDGLEFGIQLYTLLPAFLHITLPYLFSQFDLLAVMLPHSGLANLPNRS